MTSGPPEIPKSEKVTFLGAVAAAPLLFAIGVTGLGWKALGGVKNAIADTFTLGPPELDPAQDKLRRETRDKAWDEKLFNFIEKVTGRGKHKDSQDQVKVPLGPAPSVEQPSKAISQDIKERVDSLRLTETVASARGTAHVQSVPNKAPSGRGIG